MKLNLPFSQAGDCSNITIDSSKFWLLSPQEIQEMVNTNKSIKDYIQFNEDFYLEGVA